MGERFWEFLRQMLGGGLWWGLTLLNGYVFYYLAASFLSVREKWWWRALLLLLFAGSSSMVIWVGDPNLLYTLPVFLTVFFLCTRGDRVGRLAMCLVLFCLVMSVSALLDTYLGEGLRSYSWEYLATKLGRFVITGGIYLVLRRRLPEEPVALSPQLWRLVLGLSAMPFCALTAVVLLTYTKYDSQAAYSMSMNLGIVVLPFVLLTSIMLLRAVLVLANHEKLERANQLASLREVYYQGLRQQEQQVRTLRHDLRNHLTVIQGCLEQGNTGGALSYLKELSGSPALQGGHRICDNDAANAVLTAKAEAMRQAGLTPYFAVSLPEKISLSDMDLAALLGNALDNALEGTRGAAQPRISVRCKADKGLFMLRVENTMSGQVKPELATTKADKSAHGFGIPGMREIAGRYGGTLSASTRDDQFELLVCIPIQTA